MSTKQKPHFVRKPNSGWLDAEFLKKFSKGYWQFFALQVEWTGLTFEESMSPPGFPVLCHHAASH